MLKSELRYAAGRQKSGLTLRLIRLERIIKANITASNARFAAQKPAALKPEENQSSAEKQRFPQEPGLESRVRLLERRLQSAEENYIKEKQILEYKVKSAQAETDKYRLELSVRTMFDKNEKGE